MDEAKSRRMEHEAEMGVGYAKSRRLFVALLPDESARDELVATQRALLPHFDHGRLTSRENLHLTLAFLGKLDASHEERALAAMRFAAHDAHVGKICLELGDIGCFEKRCGSIVWRGLHRESEPGGASIAETQPGHERLLLLRGALGAQLLREGVIDEPLHHFSPHMTLARGCRLRKEEREAGMDAFLAQTNEQLAAHEVATARSGAARMRVGAMSLMWSHHPDGGALTYTEVARVSL